MFVRENFQKFINHFVIYAQVKIRLKVREFSSKFSRSPYSFLKPGSQDPPLFAGLRLTLHSAPHRHQRKGVHFLAISGNSKHFLFFSRKNIKIHPTGGRGGPPNLFSPLIKKMLWLKTPCKISEPYDNRFWEKSRWSRERERKKEKKKNAVNSGHLILWQHIQEKFWNSLGKVSIISHPNLNINLTQPQLELGVTT